MRKIESFKVGGWLVEPELDQIGDGVETRGIRPLVMDLLIFLAKQDGRVASTEDIIDEVWPGKFITYGTVYNCVTELRRGLERDGDNQVYVENIPKKGYRLAAPVTGLTEGSDRDGTRRNAIRSTRMIGITATIMLLIGAVSVHIWSTRSDQNETLETTASDESLPLNESIAVLPFADLSPDGDHEYLSDGVAEEILNTLTQIPDLHVISRSSAFSFKGKNVPIPTVAKQLGVTHVLEGSVRKSGDRLRVDVQLIYAETDRVLWSKSYDRELRDVLAIQDEIAAAVLGGLIPSMQDEEPRTAEINAEAYTLFLQGRHINQQITLASIHQAEELLKQSLKIDPGYAPAWTELGNVYRRQSNAFGARPIEEGFRLSRNAIEKALTIDPEFGPAYAALAKIEVYYDWDFITALQHLRRARSLSPGDAAVVSSTAMLEKTLGRIDEAIALHQQSIGLNPVSSEEYSRLGLAYYSAHRHEEAAEALRFALSLNTGRLGAQYNIGLVLLAQGDASAALVAMEQESFEGLRLHGLAIVRHTLGETKASDVALQEFIEKYGGPAAYQVAQVYAFRGEINLAFDWLLQAYDKRDGGLTLMLLDPLIDNLRSDRRWEQLLEKVGLPH